MRTRWRLLWGVATWLGLVALQGTAWADTCGCAFGSLCSPVSAPRTIDHLPYQLDGSCCDGGLTLLQQLPFTHEGTVYTRIPQTVTHHWHVFNGCRRRR